MAIDVGALKAHLNMAESEVDVIDAAVLPRLLSAATAHTERQLGYALTDTTELPGGAPADLEHAVLMLAAWWYDQRESSLVGVTAQTVPHGYDDIIREHRTYTFGVVDDV